MFAIVVAFTMFFPFVLEVSRAPVVASGPGVAGCYADPSAEWHFTWSADAGGRPWCIPMLRSNRLDNVGATMNSCGNPCNAILVGNEMESQEGCWVDCQAEFLHRVYPSIMDENPAAQVIFWNGAYPSAGWVSLFVHEWNRLFPGEPLPDVDVGVHLYLYENHGPETLLRRLRNFEDSVHSAWQDANVVVTEGGSLSSRERHNVWLSEVAPHLSDYAVFDRWLIYKEQSR